MTLQPRWLLIAVLAAILAGMWLAVLVYQSAAA